MRALLILVVIVLLMALVGWIAFDQGEDSAVMELKTDKIQQDTSDAIRNTRDWIGETGEDVKQSLPEPAVETR